MLKLLATAAGVVYLSDADRRERLRQQALRWFESSATAAQEKLGAGDSAEG